MTLKNGKDEREEGQGKEVKKKRKKRREQGGKRRKQEKGSQVFYFQRAVVRVSSRAWQVTGPLRRQFMNSQSVFTYIQII